MESLLYKDFCKLSGVSEKNFFKEKIQVFIMQVDALCKKFGLEKSEVFDKWKMEAVRMGIVHTEDQLPGLCTFLGKDLYKNLSVAASTYHDNKAMLGKYLIKSDEAERADLRKRVNGEGISLVDLFCGAGGLSLGFVQSGYSVKLAVDFEPMCIETYEYNHPEIDPEKIICGDIRKIADHIDDYVDQDVDIVIGGPPCQGFSSANKHHRVIDDPRNELYKYFIIAVKQLCPKVVVMENVKGMLKVANQVVEDYENISIDKKGKKYTYKVAYELLNSADFSVAQNRERLIYIALRNDILEEYNTTPNKIFEMIRNQNSRNHKFNLGDALEYIRPLRAPHTMGVGEKDTEENGRKIDVNPYMGNDNEYLKIINQDRYIPLVFNHKARYCSELNQEIYNRMRPGDDGTAPQIADIFPYTSRNDKFKDKYYRLYSDRPCRTITAHLRSDCHSHIHPDQNRTLTPREAARVQSFPDDYIFLGPYLKTYIQIGNAVPTVMARGIASALIPLFGKERKK